MSSLPSSPLPPTPIRADWVPETRPLDEKALLSLLDGKHVPGLNRDEPNVRVLRAGLPTEAMHKTFTMARREGFLQIDLGHGLYTDQGAIEQLLAVWGIWCAITARPPIVLTVLPEGEGRLRCDLAPVERVWTFTGFAEIGQLLAMKRPQAGCRWSFTETMLEVGGLDAGGAMAMARGVARLATGEPAGVPEPVSFPKSA